MADDPVHPGGPLPEYVTTRTGQEGLSVTVDLGPDPERAAGRLRQVSRWVGGGGPVHLLEVDGPASLPWGQYIELFFDLLLAQKVHYLAVPEGKVAGIKGQLGAHVMETVHRQLGASTLTFTAEATPLRDVISVSPLTSRVLGLSQPDYVVDNTIEVVAKALASFEENRFVPRALRRPLCNMAKLVKKNNRADRKRQKEVTKDAASSDKTYIDNDDSSSGSEDTTDEEKRPVSEGNSFRHREADEDDTQNAVNEVKDRPKAGTSKYDVKPEIPLTSKCYVCHHRRPVPGDLTDALKQYPRLCPACANLNWDMRSARTDLTGRYALVTGGRIKIGYRIVLRLLRDGCHVITTSRFPHDTAKRFSQEQDYSVWCHRLKVYALELKDIRGIYKFVEYLKRTIPHLDILINNAAQTLHRPFSFYEHLLEYERLPREALAAPQRALLAASARLTYSHLAHRLVATAQPGDDHTPVGLTPTAKRSCPSSPSSDGTTTKKAKLQTVAHPPNEGATLPTVAGPWDEVGSSLLVAGDFPTGCMDEFGQQLDLRPTNSWRATLEEVPLSELLEVMMVNTIAPYILNKELRELMVISPHQRRFIVNVSAMEGQFNRSTKTRFHPHTNMAKAALNMMTRTGALGYYDDKIYMTSVDTGWVTDERPFGQAANEAKKGFVLPLDCEDGAARVLYPIVTGVNNKEKEPYYAVFLKNYSPYPW